jgi:hypothetical protein
MENADNFYILLASNASTEIYENTLTKFKSRLPQIPNFSLNGWSVALQAIALDLNLSYYPNALQNIHSPILYSQVGFVKPVPLPFNILQFDIHHYSSTIAFQREFARKLKQEKKDKSQRLFIGIDVVNSKMRLILPFATQLWIDVRVCKWLCFPIQGLEVLNGGEYSHFSRTITALKDNFEHVMPEYIKIHMQEMKSNLSNAGFEKVLAYVPYVRNNNNTNYTIYHEVLRKEYFTIDYNSNPMVSNLSIKLTDENNQQLGLLPGQPTIVKLKLRKMSYTSFMLRIKSAAQNTMYEMNTNHDFHTTLPYPINLSGKWKVALTSIQFPRQFDLANAIPNEGLYIDVNQNKRKRRHMLPGESVYTFVDLKHIRRWRVPSRIKKSTNAQQSEDLTVPTVDNAAAAAAKKLNHWDRITIPKNAIASNSKLRNVINKMLREHFGKKVLEFLPGKTARVKAHELIKFRVSSYLAYILGVSSSFDDPPIESEVKSGEGGIYDLPTDVFRLTPHSLLLYCDIITPVIIGDSYAKVLKLIPLVDSQKINTEKNNYIFYESQHLDFIPLAHTTLSTCHFSLCHVSGVPFLFNNKNQEVNINLVFMKDVL